ncbi:PepSY domain-containing protein [Vibrio rotiferianus]|uniref:PepSY domain-containing protein n=1 Tax=Vibrio rotiferianus TaxID=190895 RepID=UPI000B59E90E|nr:PepSY domain-containing protein [Vibrio rotiferianus]ASI93478.1 peptidase [Vibrio rotiferianus]
MKKLILCSALTAFGLLSLPSHAANDAKVISQEEAIKAALGALDIEVLGIRHDEPDSQWDVFVKKDDKAYEIEVDARSGKIIAAEEESLAEIKAELSGDLSHEGVVDDVDK